MNVRIMEPPLADLEVTTLSGETKTLAEHRGKVWLVVNTASQCGYTPQYAGLEKLYAKYKERGLVVLGFPCNQFGHQEPGSAEDIATFCDRTYGVTFPMHAKVDVNGGDAHPLFKRLKHDKAGILGTEAIKWNFTKFLVGRDGATISRHGSRTTPEELEAEIERLLAAPGPSAT